ncbi:MAG: cupredoxin domain-containing protein [Nitrospiria bacterium]
MKFLKTSIPFLTLFLLVSLSIVKGDVKPVQDVRNLNVITVEKGTLAFSPKVILVKPGTTVTWVNQDIQDHFLMFSSATSDVKTTENEPPVNEPLHPGTRYQHKISHTGIYPFFCGIHNQMWGMVMVDENVASK